MLFGLLCVLDFRNDAEGVFLHYMAMDGQAGLAIDCWKFVVNYDRSAVRM